MDSRTPGNSNADGDQADPAAIDLVTVSTATACFEPLIKVPTPTHCRYSFDNLPTRVGAYCFFRNGLNISQG